MAKKVTTSTRNKEFNYYYENELTRAYVTSATANTKAKQAEQRFQNIRLLNVNDAIEKTGTEIIVDALANTTLMEADIDVDKNTAKNFAYLAVFGDPESDVYKKVDASLAKYNFSLEKIKETMVIDYRNYLHFGDLTKKYYIFGAPDQVVLNNRQHYNNCGIESTLNNLAMAGQVTMKENLKDQKSVEKNFLKAVWDRNLCEDSGQVGVLDRADGGTYPDNYKEIFAYYDIDSTAYYISNKCDGRQYTDLNKLGYDISQGHGAIVAVCSDVLWNDIKSEQQGSDGGSRKIDHAISITGVVYDTDDIDPANNDGNYVTPVGFYIHDTGAWMTRFISLDDFKKATLYDFVYADKDDFEHNKSSSLKEFDTKLQEFITKDSAGIFITITNTPIKTEMFNLNATGDKYANKIWGNNGDNIIKGMAGNDTLYGGAGNDTIYGGAGNDVVVGNNAFKFVANIEDPAVTLAYNTIEDFKGFLNTAGAMDQALEERLGAIKVDDYGTKDFTDVSTLYDYMSEHIPGGINTLDGGDGSDIIIGGEYADLIYGGKGNDYIYAGDGRNAAYGGKGNDIIVGGYDSDRLFGDAGNDYIFGYEDDDTINGGDGNDHIYGGNGNDRIETGKGTDTVHIEGMYHGVDTVSSKSGNTILKFDAAGAKASDMFISLGTQENNKKLADLGILYEQNVDDPLNMIKFEAFYNNKTGKTKSLTFFDAEDELYNISVSSKKKASVANTKTTGTTKVNGVKTSNADINNVLLSTYTKGAKITTSKKNDIVTMIDSDSKSGNTYDSENIVDKITYTGGYDKYVSEERNTYYTVNFGADTTLSIYDNVDGLTRTIFNKEKWELAGEPEYLEPFYEKVKNLVSTHDSLQLSTHIDAANFFFDVAAEGKETLSNALYITDSADKYLSIAQGADVSGFIYMDSFFNGADYSFFGNGRIENLYYTDETNKVVKYDTFSSDLETIANQVAGWLSTYHSECDSVFDALQKGSVTINEMNALIAAYHV